MFKTCEKMEITVQNLVIILQKKEYCIFTANPNKSTFLHNSDVNYNNNNQMGWTSLSLREIF